MKKELADYLNKDIVFGRKRERYDKVFEQMELLNIQDVATNRQHRNGTRVWQLPIKCGKDKFIEVASFATGYVRNQNSGYSNYQLNKRCESDPQYYPVYEWCDESNMSVKTDKFRQYTTRSCKLIPKEIDRLEYLISYCLKNYYIKNANQVAEGSYVSKWYHEYQMEKHEKTAATYQQIIDEMNDKHRDICEYTWSGGQITDSETGEIYVHEQHAYWNKIPNSVQVIVDGHRYNVK